MIWFVFIVDKSLCCKYDLNGVQGSLRCITLCVRQTSNKVGSCNLEKFY